MLRVTFLLAALLAAGLLWSGCDSGDGGGSEVPTDDPSLAASGSECTTTMDCAGSLICYQAACTNPADVTDPSGINPTGTSQGGDCGLDLAQMGKEIGDVVGNFALPDQDGQTYELHDNCNTEKKAIWIVLAAGW